MEQTITGVGERVRALRRSRSLTLDAVAADTGFTPGYLSQIENGKTVPSLSALASIAGALSADITAFFPHEDPSKVRVSRAGDPNLLRIEQDGANEYIVLSGRGNGAAFSALIARHTTRRAFQNRYLGERFAYVRSGEIAMDIDGTAYELGPGSFLHYSSHVEHSLRPSSAEPTEMLWLVSPPIV